MNKTAAVFSEGKFLIDAEAMAKAIGAPYDEETTRRVVEVFGSHFHTGAVLWKTTDRPGDHLGYRFFARERTDTVETALAAGLIRRSALTALVAEWDRIFETDAIQSCDFDGFNGMAKTWVYLGGMRPAEQVLDNPAVPPALRAQLPGLKRVGLDHVRFTAVDYRHGSLNVYFRARGPLTPSRAAQVLGAVGITAPDDASVARMRTVVPEDFCLAVTFAMDTGRAVRACFYALGIPENRIPPLPQRISAFFETAPDNDIEVIRGLGWSHGPGEGTYLKAEHSYCGDMAGRLRDWDCYLTGSAGRDPILAAADALPAATGAVAPPMVRVVNAETAYEGKQKMGLVAGICRQTVGSQGLCMHLIAMPPLTRGAVHIHDGHESSLYVTSGRTRTYFGHDLEHHVDSGVGELLYIPAGLPHVAANLENEPAAGVIARTDPDEQESVRLIPELEEKAAALFAAHLAQHRAETAVGVEAESAVGAGVGIGVGITAGVGAE
ncbi:aromatic prenyltransferase [Streptomyces sp. SID3343]|uniref:aromatic prenyltransferase n=1 Tax=Streptomyces sp. SID3343 TaxID=2690260 RepID=UPI0013721D3A|nr:aromatic prenyltransferase [Streptomyces sp. SID3343]MYW01968.1 cupin domain-containing protein [Streptomyces sp. SID3343]